MNTAATLFSGGGGADIGLDAAGVDVRWGLEYDGDIAQVARDNGLDIHPADVTEVDPSWYESVDVLHASPPCPNFSVAKTGGEETDEDVSLAEATTNFIREVEPQLFTLENVWGYRKSRSWTLIRECLSQLGYDWNAWKINAADYGVPQTRKRMIVAARKDGQRPKKPPATHAENPSSGGLFGGDLNECVGWYEAVEDLIPDLPETELADWQKERLPDELSSSVQVDGDSAGKEGPIYRMQSAPIKSVTNSAAPRAIICDTQPNARGDNREGREPTKTVAADPAGGAPRAVLVSNANTQWGDGTHEGDDPSLTVTDQHGGRLRAVLVKQDYADSNRSEQRAPQTKDLGEPTASVRGSESNSQYLRAVLVKGSAVGSDEDIGDGEGHPAGVVKSETGRRDPWRAVLVNATSNMQVADEDHPAYGQVARERSYQQRAVMGRRVVQMTPRALARFQTFPDWYELPETKSLACRIIGNAVPPLLMKKCAQHWIEEDGK